MEIKLGEAYYFDGKGFWDKKQLRGVVKISAEFDIDGGVFLGHVFVSFVSGGRVGDWVRVEDLRPLTELERVLYGD